MIDLAAPVCQHGSVPSDAETSLAPSPNWNGDFRMDARALDIVDFDAATVARFWAKVDRSGGSDACWPWLANRRRRGYGSFKIASGRHGPRGGRRWATKLAHRASWSIAFGRIPDTMHVLHRCDNPPCVNPAHLFLGTALDNIRDRHAKHRDARQQGESHGAAKLTAAQVEEIRAARASQSEIAARFGLEPSHVSRIRRGKSWAHTMPSELQR